MTRSTHSVIVKTATNSRNIDNISTVVETKFDRVAQDVVNLQASDQQQETKLKAVSTHGKWCGYQDGWNTANSIITYDSLKYSSSNMNISSPLILSTGDNSHACYYYLVISLEMEINVCRISGIFTVPAPGAWRVSFSLYSVVPSGGSHNHAWLYFNGKQLGETGYWSRSSGETGGREYTLKAGRGDTISLRTSSMGSSGTFRNIIFCVAFEHGSELQKRLSDGDEDMPSPDYKDNLTAGDEDIPSPNYKGHISAGDEDIPSPDNEGHFTAGNEDIIPSPDYKGHFTAEDEEYLSPDLEKPQSCYSNAECPSHLTCIR